MVKRQRRMTTRKKTGVKKSVPKQKKHPQSKTKVQQRKRSSSSTRSKKIASDRASQAMKVLLKGLKKGESE